MFAVKRASARGIKVIWWGHGIRPSSSPKATQIYVDLAIKASACILYGQGGADKLASLGVQKEKLFVARNSLDIPEIVQFRQNTPEHERFRIIYLGGVLKEKKPDLLIHAFAKALPRLDESINLTVVGEGPYDAVVRDLVAKLNISGRVEFTGGIYSNSELAPYMNSAWISVTPGYAGLNLLHSLAFGVPILVADNEPHSPEISSLVVGSNGEYFTANSADDLADKLVALSRNAEQRTRLRNGAMQSVTDEYGIDRMARSFEKAVSFAHGESL